MASPPKKKRAPRKRAASSVKKTSAKTATAAVSKAKGPSLGSEALGVLLMLMGVGLGLALYSYDPERGDQNWMGTVGHRLADMILSGIGVVGFLAVALSVVIAGAALLGRLRMPSFVSLVSGVALVIAATVVAHLFGREVYGKPAGGYLGAIAGSQGEDALGGAGTLLGALGLFVVSVMGLARVSPVRALVGVVEGVGRGLSSVASSIGTWREARAAARKRAREVELAARVVEAEEIIAEVDPPADVSRARVDREERRRSAIRRAEAEAEAKALEKVARRKRKSAVGANTPVPSMPMDDDVDVGAPPVLVSLNIPGPAAETRFELEAGPLEDAADVLERIAEHPVESEPGLGRGPRRPDASEVETIAVIHSEGRAARPSQPPPVPVEPISDVPRSALPPPVPVDSRGSFPPPPPQDSQPPQVLPEEPVDLADLESEPEAGPVVHERKEVAITYEEASSERPREKKEYRLPPIQLLDHDGEVPEPVDQGALRVRATRLEQKLETYGVKGKVTAIRPGPVVTTYEYQPAPGVKVSKIAGLQDDIAMSMEALRVRIVAPIPGRGVVGIELPNEARENVYLKEIVAHESFRKSKSLLTLALGKDAEGVPQVRNLQKMPHLLVAGTTGSGKSVSINTMVLSMLYKATPEQVKFIMVDPKMLELSLYNDIPHLLLPVVTDPRKASLALQWTVDEMERRYQLLSDFKVRDLETFNNKLGKLSVQREAEAALATKAGLGSVEASPESKEPQPELPFDARERKGRIRDPWQGKDVPETLPYIVVLIDEFADLMTVAPRDVETSVQRLAQKARAAGIHVLLATQRPSTDVITGVIKNNFPCRVAFRVASRHDSATIINMPGAEALLGRGDSLMMDTTSPTPARIHGSFVSEEEVERVVEFWKEQGRPVYDETILQPREEEGADGGADADDVDEHYDMAVKIVCDTKKASISALQRRLRVGYNRAARMIEMMEKQGIVGPATGPKGEREILAEKID
ncbi:MAG: DNA translocase FtsK 4TM domain-containing protein [Myxococcota bacterium]